MTVTVTTGLGVAVSKPPDSTARVTTGLVYAAMPEGSSTYATTGLAYVATLQESTPRVTTAVAYVTVKSVRYSDDAGLIQHPYFGELKVYILWDTYTVSNVQERIVTERHDGETNVQKGKDPFIWTGHFVTYLPGKAPDGVADMNLLRAVWERSMVFTLVDTQGNVYMGNGPLNFIWVGDFEPNWLGPNTEVVHIPFRLMEVS